MNAGATTGRVLDAIRLRIRMGGWRPGVKLDPGVIASDLASSVTPVRDALHLLTGQGLVAARMGEGFAMPALDAPGLQDLYAWTGEVALLALRFAKIEAINMPGALPPRDTPYADAIEQLFVTITGWSDNLEHRRAMAFACDRLHAVRMIEPRVLDACDNDVARLSVAIEQGAPRALRDELTRYHARRRRAAPVIVRALYRSH